jgi:hypothetical protein
VPLRTQVRSLLARVVRPAFVALDHRLEQIAARLELHTKNLSDVQLATLTSIGHRIDLDAAVVSEHLVGIERAALAGGGRGPADRLVIARPGAPLDIPAGAVVDSCAAYLPEPDGSWRRVASTGDDTLRIARLVARPGA